MAVPLLVLPNGLGLETDIESLDMVLCILKMVMAGTGVDQIDA